MNDTLKIIKERSSVRAYTGEPLSEDEIRAIVEAGLQAPTARNMREVHISVIPGNHPLLKEIDIENKSIMLENADAAAKDAIMGNPNNFYYNAPCVFILSVDKDFVWNKVDAGIAVENMSIAASSMGLGNLIIGIISRAMSGNKKEYFAKALNFPENYEFAIAFAAGRKAADKAPHDYDYDSSVSFI